MQKKSNLLQEAIADAKAVREMALENAKEALKEAFTPKLQSMLSAKIQQEMEEMDEGEGYDAEKTNDPADLNQFPDKGDGEQTPDFKEEKELEEAADLKSSEIGGADNKEPTKAAHGDVSSTDDEEGNTFGAPAKEDEDLVPDDSKYGMEEGVEEKDEDDEDEIELDEELDLESIIKELEEDYMDDDYMDDEEEEPAVDYGEEEPVAPEAPVAPEMEPAAAPVAPEMGAGGEDDDIDIDIELEPEEEGMYGENVDELEERREGGYEDAHEEKLDDLDEALTSLKQADTIKELEAKVKQLEGQLNKKSAIVKEYHSGVKYLKEKLNEVNVLNAKLLFTNKLFRNFNLDQKGKLRVIENFDRAQNIREIKLVFTTLAENLKSTQAVSQSKKQAVKRITEGASKVTESTKPKDEKILKESGNASVIRAQKLAGITK